MQSGILVVSSQRADLDALQSVLASDSLHLVTVRSYREALSALSKENVSLILCDDALPDGNWKDLLGRIAMIPDSPPLVVFTAAANKTLRVEAIGLGAYDVLAKPIDRCEIQNVIGRAVTVRGTKALVSS